MANRSLSHYPDLGALGEDLVARWLQVEGWTILHRRWYCPGGELDIVGQPQPGELVFVEVKTRSGGNWDADGLLSVTSQKQAKLWQAAELFLAAYPELADLACRFDVALVRCQRLPAISSGSLDARSSDRLPPSLTAEQHDDRAARSFILPPTTSNPGYRLVLQQYIESAFSH